MKNYIKIPNLPEEKVNAVLVDFRICKDSIKTLNSLGIKVYTTKSTNSLYDAISGHPDVVFHHLGDKKFVVSPENADYFSSIPEIEIIVGESILSSKYPDDIAYNAARVGNFLIHNFKYTDKMILNHSEHLTKINVNQGYSKCSICVVDENAIITSDMGIAKKCDLHGIDVLFVNDENIKLPGVSHGFFGGATGKISKNILAVNGDINYHKNHKEIIKFLDKYNIKIATLNPGIIEDIGTIIGLY